MRNEITLKYLIERAKKANPPPILKCEPFVTYDNIVSVLSSKSRLNKNATHLVLGKNEIELLNINLRNTVMNYHPVNPNDHCTFEGLTVLKSEKFSEIRFLNCLLHGEFG